MIRTDIMQQAKLVSFVSNNMSRKCVMVLLL